eukprot:6189462-Pleurochrysis_carterae.AAC.2
MRVGASDSASRRAASGRSRWRRWLRRRAARGSPAPRSRLARASRSARAQTRPGRRWRRRPPLRARAADRCAASRRTGRSEWRERTPDTQHTCESHYIY